MKKKQLIVAVALASLMSSSATNANIQDELKEWMSAGEFVNVNQPTAYESQAGGYGVSLGGVRARNSVVPVGAFASGRSMKMSAGCGGIDMDLGGFNFVNKDQIVQQLRAIASNAKGMIFQMAIDTVSSMLGNNMKMFKNMADFMNKYQTDSCHAASQLMSKVTDVVSGDVSRNSCISKLIDQNGLSYDQAFRECGSGGARVSTNGSKSDQNTDTWKAGNLAWAILMQDDYFRRNQEMAVLMMNITGTIIIRPAIAGVETNTGDQNELKDVKNYIQPWFLTNPNSNAKCKNNKDDVGNVCFSQNANRLFEILVTGTTTTGDTIKVFKCKDGNMQTDENGCPDVERNNGSAVYENMSFSSIKPVKPEMVALLNSIQIKMLQKDSILSAEEKAFISDMDGAIYHYMLASTTLLRMSNSTDPNLNTYLTLMAKRKVAENFLAVTKRVREAMTAGKLGVEFNENKEKYTANLEQTILAFAGIAADAEAAMNAMQQMQQMANLYEKALVSSMSTKMLSKVKFGG